MSIITDPDDYNVRISEPYLIKDIMGNYVILRDETLYCENPTMQGHKLIFMSEILVNENPSPAEIFKIKLANPNNSV